MKNNSYWKKLGLGNLMLVFFLNTVLPWLCVPLARLLSPAATMAERERIGLLLLMLMGVILLAVDLHFVIRPILRLENLVRNFHLQGENDVPLTSSSALSDLFIDLLQKQRESTEFLYKSEVLRQQSELLALQSQINPHFLYNTLDSIRGLALLNDVPEIADMSEALARLFRSMINKEGEFVSLAEELQTVHSYMTIQQYRFNQRFVLVDTIQDAFLLMCRVPNFILQPLVENAIFHGLESIREKGRVILQAYATERRVVIQVEDNGVGMDAETLHALRHSIQQESILSADIDETQRGKHIALRNINQRIRLQFGEEYGLYIMSTPRVNTVVEVVLPRIDPAEEEA